MNETCTDQNTKCKCSYSGIGVNYTAINAEEATVWNNAISSKNENITTPQKVSPYSLSQVGRKAKILNNIDKE